MLLIFKSSLSHLKLSLRKFAINFIISVSRLLSRVHRAYTSSRFASREREIRTERTNFEGSFPFAVRIKKFSRENLNSNRVKTEVYLSFAEGLESILIFTDSMGLRRMHLATNQKAIIHHYGAGWGIPRLQWPRWIVRAVKMKSFRYKSKLPLELSHNCKSCI